MRKLLACLVMCAAVVGCDGETPADDGQTSDLEGREEGTEHVAQVGSSGGKEPTLPGIGDGQTGGRPDAGVSLPGAGTTRPGTVGTATRPVAPATPGRAATDSVGGERSGVADSAGGRATGTPPPSAAPSPSGSTGFVPPGDVVAPGRPIVPPTRPPPTTVPVRPGTLTAGTWDDNRNFAFFQRYRASVQQSVSGILPFSDAEFVKANEKFSQPQGARQRLDIALVIDTTGSMGDEITYLQTELLAISRTIELAYPQAAQRWALVVYRDEGDEYTTRYFDFRDNPAELREKLAAQRASGGGDFPEAPQAAFSIVNQLAWRTGSNVARLAFWVADAPHHAQQAANLADGIRKSQGLNVHVYPVASSGVDELTELTMRSAAQLTGGRYLFLTDDSRVGNSHKEPTIPCYFVTKLDEAIFRMVSVEMSGVYREPDAQQVVRVSGDPQRGICRLTSGQDVQIF